MKRIILSHLPFIFIVLLVLCIVLVGSCICTSARVGDVTGGVPADIPKVASTARDGAPWRVVGLCVNGEEKLRTFVLVKRGEEESFFFLEGDSSSYVRPGGVCVFINNNPRVLAISY